MHEYNRDGLLSPYDLESCTHVRLTKMTMKVFTSDVEQACKLLKFIHSDVCNPMYLPACSG